MFFFVLLNYSTNYPLNYYKLCLSFWIGTSFTIFQMFSHFSFFHFNSLCVLVVWFVFFKFYFKCSVVKFLSILFFQFCVCNLKCSIWLVFNTFILFFIRFSFVNAVMRLWLISFDWWCSYARDACVHVWDILFLFLYFFFVCVFLF